MINMNMKMTNKCSKIDSEKLVHFRNIIWTSISKDMTYMSIKKTRNPLTSSQKYIATVCKCNAYANCPKI